MNVKKYRATTTREALEQIKQDLGEDAFVLETKQVRTGGFLGFKAETQVEISAAAPALAHKPAPKSRARFLSSPIQKLNLTDDTPAAPQSFPAENDAPKKDSSAALNARAELLESFGSALAATRQTAEPVLGKNRAEIEAVEISSEAPRFVHVKKESNRQSVFEPTAAAETIEAAAPTAMQTISSREFELLRAELREVKFSLGAFAGRQNVPTWDHGISLEDFGEVFDSPFYDSYIELTAAGVSADSARQIIADAIPAFKNGIVAAAQVSEFALVQAFSKQIAFEPDLLAQEKPLIMAVIGATGVGKTTTVAKLAARLALHEQRRVELVTLDTYRIAAVEQLRTYAEIIGAGCQVVNSVLELDAVLRRVPADATVLIDTTGRNPFDLADQYEFSDYLRQHGEIRKCLAVQATVHPLDASAAIKKFEMYGADCLAITKLDETTRPGAMIELVAESRLPLAYFCMGQRVPEDLQTAAPETFAARILRRKI